MIERTEMVLIPRRIVEKARRAMETAAILSLREEHGGEETPDPDEWDAFSDTLLDIVDDIVKQAVLVDER